MKLLLRFATLSLMLSASSQIPASDGLNVLPANVHLTGPESRQTLIVESTESGYATGQVGDAKFSSDNENVAKIIDSVIIPTGNGVATITVTRGGRTASTRVTVDKFDIAQQWTFRNHVQSVLSKTGCNSGACHGATAGKNGFKLSLRGYDPEADFFSITRQARGRRLVPDDPGRSLILTKPTGMIPHKGGVRFAEDSHEFHVIAAWLAQGQQGPAANDAKISHLRILPENARLVPGTEQQLIVQAQFTDGHTEDVTRWAKYASTNHTVCQVNEIGATKVTGSGEGAVVAWYLAQNATATITVPYIQQVRAEAFTEAPRANFIDEFVLEKLIALNIPPSARSDDSEFVRRVYLDTIGTLPTIDEARAFLEDTDPEKRLKLIEQLLARPEFVDYWAYQWSDLLLLTGNRLRPQAVKTYDQWIRERVANNVPWDEFARGVMLAKGSTFDNGAANFYALHQDPQDMVETTSMAFLGMSIQCAHCHDHPNEKWTNDDYYGMVSLFARVRGKGWGGDFRGGDGNRVIFIDDQGEVLQPRTAKPQPPKPLDGDPISFDGLEDRREHLARWLTSPQNPYFAKAIVNRVWANYMGKGLVESIDDIRQTNPASNEKLFAHLAEQLVENQYDLKWLMRTILQSESYQRSHQTTKENVGDQRFYAHAYPRRLKAEVLLDAISQVTASPTSFKDQPAGTRALQLPDSSITSYFLDAFGRPERLLTCTCERSDEPSMTQVLHLTNGKTIQEKVEAKEGRITQLLSTGASSAEIIDNAYLAALSRHPTDRERSRLSTILDETADSEKRQAVEDLFWSILTSKEFLFQH
jgi:hypothetical protein